MPSRKVVIVNVILAQELTHISYIYIKISLDNIKHSWLHLSLFVFFSVSETYSKMQSLLKCPPYCRVNCSTKHHPLLVVLLNCGDTDDKGVMKQRLHDLKHVVMRYEKIGKWKKDNNIPDAVEHYRFPMIHWACALGRASAVEWLVQHGLDPTTRTLQDEQEETALHRAIICLQETCPNNAAEKFEHLLPSLQDAMFTVDGTGNLPIHTCCDFLANEMPKPEFYQRCASAMISHLKKQENNLLKKLFETENPDGNTPLHILCRNDRCFFTVAEMIQAGASIENKNHKGQSPLDVALEKGQVKLVRYLYDEINPNAAPFASNTTDIQEKARTQHNKRTPKVATRKVYDSKGMVIGEEVKVMLKNQGQKGKRSLNSDNESPSGGASPSKRINDGASPSIRSPESRSPETTQPVKTEDSDDESDDEDIIPPRIVNMLPTPELKQKICNSTEFEFVEFIYKAGPHLQQQLLEKLKEEQRECNSSITFLEYINKELANKQEDVQTKQRAIILQIQSLLTKLSKVQKEESRMVQEYENIDHDLQKAYKLEADVKDRLTNCSEALQILLDSQRNEEV